MDNDENKQCSCKTKGCGISFVDEEHLSIHEKKHEMVLNLCIGNKSNSAFVADQTPTPTRLIKNCEEVGLFDDLKHVNPFEETFRRAVELKSTTSTPGQTSATTGNISENLTCDESLHTPQVFPNCENVDATTDFQVEKQSIILSENISIKQKIKNDLQEKEVVQKKRKQSLDKKINNGESVEKKTIQHTILNKPLLLPNNVSILQTSKMIAISSLKPSITQSLPLILPKVTPIEKIENSQNPIKEKLKAVLNSTRIRSNKLKLSSSNTNPSTNNNTPPTNEHVRKYSYDKDCMERRRAAAMRYRRKVKKEQTDLRKTNAALLAENNQLKAENKKLKEILLLQQNGQIPQILPLVNNAQICEPQIILKTPPIQIPASAVKFYVNIPRIVRNNEVPVKTPTN